MGKVIGIDLGTTNSCVAVLEAGEPVVITNSEGARTTPSVVGFKKDGERIVGQVAKRQAVANADRTVISIKRHMGSDYKVKIDDKEYSPQEISAMILSKMKKDAEDYLGQPVTEAVITVPAYFTDSQRQATKDAGKIAGLDVKRIINEPTAAALAYGLDKADKSTHKILIYDLGGGTFDVSILEIGDGVFEVLATSGDNMLGGDDFDSRVMQYLVEEFKKAEGIDLAQDKSAMQRLKEAAEKAKIELSSTSVTNVNLPFISADDSGPKHLDLDITRQKFDALTADLVQRTVIPMNNALKDAGLTKDDLEKVVLVGGSTRIPAVKQAVKDITGKEPYQGINPDECVAIGAAVQGGVLAGDVKDVLLLDVTPLSLGIETAGGVFTKLIERNTTIPTRQSQIFSTAADGQTSVNIHILQGEREMAAYNKTLGRFDLTGIPPAPRGVPQIEVTFDIDANGIVNVSAVDKGTGKSQNIVITSSTNLTDSDIEKAIKEAQEYASEDTVRKQNVENRAKLDQLIFSIEKFIRENNDKFSDEDKTHVKEVVDGARKSLESNDTAKILSAIDSVTELSGEVFSKLYHSMQTEDVTAEPVAEEGATEAAEAEEAKTEGEDAAKTEDKAAESADTEKAEEPKTEEPKAEKAEEPKAEKPKAEEPKAEKAEAPKVEEPKAKEAPKAEPVKEKSEGKTEKSEKKEGGEVKKEKKDKDGEKKHSDGEKKHVDGEKKKVKDGEKKVDGEKKKVKDGEKKVDGEKKKVKDGEKKHVDTDKKKEDKPKAKKSDDFDFGDLGGSDSSDDFNLDDFDIFS